MPINTLMNYLLSIFLLFVGAYIILRIFVRRDYYRRGNLSVITSALQALLFFVYGGFPYIYLPIDWPVSKVNILLRVIGLTMLIIGLVIIFIGIFRLGILRSFGRQTGILKEVGLYRVSRNPQVLGCVMYVIGFVILWPSWYAVGWGLLFAPIIHLMVLTEEEHLRNFYGPDFAQYWMRVPRYLGFSKPWNREKY